MDVEYLACGNIMSDRIENEDGSYSPWQMGGPAFFGLSGIRLWTKSCKLVCQTGKDALDTYGVWMDNNGVSKDSMRIEMENVTRFTLKYGRYGKFVPTHHFSAEHLGYLKTHPEHIAAACGPKTKGIYMAQNTDEVFWRQLKEIKEKFGFKIMWEVEYSPHYNKDIPVKNFLEKIYRTMEVADLWSINHNEASDLFGIPREEDEAIIREIQKMPVELTLYRVGRRGAYAVTPTEAYFCESIDPFGPSADPTGCGNSSTAAAMFAHVSGQHPAMVAVMANISSGFNAAQHGPFPLYTDKDMELAHGLAKQHFEKARQWKI